MADMWTVMQGIHAPGPNAIYVSTAGNDSNPGTAGSRKRTVEAALTAMPAGGGVIYVADGDYGNIYINGRQFSNSAWCIIKAENVWGARATSVNISGKYVGMYGFEVNGGGSTESSCILVSNCAFVAVWKCHSYNAGATGIGGAGNLSSISNISICYNLVHSTSAGSQWSSSAISFFQFENTIGSVNHTWLGGYDNVLVGNVIYDTNLPAGLPDGNGIIIDDMANQQSFSPRQGTPYQGNFLVMHNLVVDSVGRGLHFFQTSNVDVIFNTTSRNSGFNGGGFDFNAGATSGVSNFGAYGNLCYETGSGVQAWYVNYLASNISSGGNCYLTGNTSGQSAGLSDYRNRTSDGLAYFANNAPTLSPTPGTSTPGTATQYRPDGGTSGTIERLTVTQTQYDKWARWPDFFGDYRPSDRSWAIGALEPTGSGGGTPPAGTIGTLAHPALGQPGHLMTSSNLGSANGGTCYRITYQMRAAMGNGGGIINASALAYIPPGTPPANGWRFLTVAHGVMNDQLKDVAAASLAGTSDNLQNACGPVNQWLALGFAVVQTDYEGVFAGGDSNHYPVYTSKSFTHSMLGAAKALAGLTTIRASGAAAGFSMGGPAALACGEWQQTLYPEIQQFCAVGFDPWIPKETTDGYYSGGYGDDVVAEYIYGLWLDNTALPLSTVVTSDSITKLQTLDTYSQPYGIKTPATGGNGVSASFIANPTRAGNGWSTAATANSPGNKKSVPCRVYSPSSGGLYGGDIWLSLALAQGSPATRIVTGDVGHAVYTNYQNDARVWIPATLDAQAGTVVNPPVAAFTASDTTPDQGQTIQFTDTSTGSPNSWSWNFGDGSTSTLQNPSKSWSTTGAKTVTLTVTNSVGTSSASATYTVAAVASGPGLISHPGLGVHGHLLTSTSNGTTAGGKPRYKITYQMTSITGAIITATAVVAFPAAVGSAPATGWPIITGGHGATGTNDAAAPSGWDDDMSGSVGNVDSWLNAGYAVVQADYEGLNPSGDALPHPYMVGVSHARALLDAAIACSGLARIKASGAAVGFSQGGHASLFAAEYADSYASVATGGISEPAFPSGTPINITTLGVSAGGGDQQANIQNAINNAAAGSILLFPSGTYNHSGVITINKSITLYSTAGAILSGSDPLNMAIKITANNVRIEGLTVRGTGSTRQSNDDIRACISSIGVTGTVIKNCIVRQSSAAGIFLEGSSGYYVVGNTVENTLSDAIHQTGSANNGYVLNNTVTSPADDCIAIVSYAGQDCNNITVKGNTVTGGGARGLSVVGGRDCVLQDNTISGSVAAGIYIASESSYNTEGVNRITVTNNTLNGCNTNVAINHGGIFLWGGNTGKPVQNVMLYNNKINNTVVGGAQIVIQGAYVLATKLLNNATTGTKQHSYIEAASGEWAMAGDTHNGASVATHGATPTAPAIVGGTTVPVFTQFCAVGFDPVITSDYVNSIYTYQYSPEYLASIIYGQWIENSSLVRTVVLSGGASSNLPNLSTWDLSTTAANINFGNGSFIANPTTAGGGWSAAIYNNTPGHRKARPTRIYSPSGGIGGGDVWLGFATAAGTSASREITSGGHAITNISGAVSWVTGALAAQTGTSAPVAAFNASTLTPQINESVGFTDTSTNGPTSWVWNFGDGTTSTSQNPSKAWTTTGAKTVTLTVTNAQGTNQTSKTITVTAIGPPVANFTTTPSPGVVGQTVQFTDTSSGSPTSRLWTFGDGVTDLFDPGRREVAYQLLSSAENSDLDWRAQYSYIQDIGDGRGYTAGVGGFCSGTGDMLMVVDRYIALKPTGNTLQPYRAALVAVNGTDSHAGLGTPFTNAWVAAVADPLFKQAQDEIRNELYFVPAVNQAKADGLGALGQFCYFDHSILNGFDGMMDGIRAVVIANGVKPPSQGGTESAYLLAWLNQAIVQMDTDPAHSDHSRVIAQKKFRTEGKFGLELPLSWVMYGDSFSIATVSPAYTAGATSTAANPTRTFSTAGIYSVTLQVTNAQGTNSVTKSITIDPTGGGGGGGGGGTALTLQAEEGTISGSAYPNPDYAMHVAAENPGYSGSGYVGYWGQPGENLDFTLTGMTAGQYSLVLRYQKADTSTPTPRTIYVNGSLATTLNLSRTGTDWAASSWTDTSPINITLTSGTNTISIRQSGNADLFVDLDRIVVTSLAPSGNAPVAGFTRSPSGSQLTGTLFTFTDTSSNTPTSWNWNFGDGATSTSQNPTHTYVTAGTYSVTLQAINAFGNTLTTQTITVTTPVLPSNPPVASFLVSATVVSVGQVVTFTDTSTNTPTSWAWNFGDSSTATIKNPTHAYAAPGTYSISLQATNADGNDTASHQVVVLAAPTIDPNAPEPINRYEFRVLAKRQLSLSEQNDLHRVMNIFRPAQARMHVGYLAELAYDDVPIIHVAADSEWWEVVSQVVSRPGTEWAYAVPGNPVEPQEQPRPPFSVYQGEQWSYVSDISSITSYAEEVGELREDYHQRVAFHDGSHFDYRAELGCRWPQDVITERLAIDGSLTSNPLAIEVESGKNRWVDRVREVHSRTSVSRSGISPLYFNGISIEDLALRAESIFSPHRRQAGVPQRFWATPERSKSDPAMESIEIRLRSQQRVNRLRFQLAHFPHRAFLEVWDASYGIWRELWRTSISDSVPTNLSSRVDDQHHYHPQHSMNGHWVSFDLKVEPVVGSRFRIRMQRLATGSAPLNSAHQETTYSLGVRGFDIGYVIEARNDIPQLPVETPIGNSVDPLGSRTLYSLRERTARLAVDGDSETAWMSEPQPVSQAVVSFYADMRTAAGLGQVVDRWYLDPIKPGPNLNLYYSNDDAPDHLLVSDDTPLGVGEVEGEGLFTSIDDGISFDDADPAYFIVPNRLIQFSYTADWWFGCEIVPRFVSTAADSPIISWGDFSIQFGDESIIFASPSGNDVVLSFSWHANQIVRVFVGFDTTTNAITIGAKAGNGAVEIHTEVLNHTVTGYPQSVRIASNPSLSTPPNFILRSLVLNQSAPPQPVEFLIDPEPWIVKATYRLQDSGKTNGALLRMHPTFINGVNYPFGLVGGPGDGFAGMSWTPIPRDFRLQKGWINLPPTKAKFWKFEFSQLVMEPIEVQTPLRRSVRVFPLSATFIDTNLREDPSLDIPAYDAFAQGWQTYQDSSAPSDEPSQSRLMPTSLVYATDPTGAQRLRTTDWSYGFTPWHVGAIQPRFTREGVHEYDYVSYLHSEKIGFFVGIKEIRAGISSFQGNDNPSAIIDRFFDTSRLSSSTWSVQPGNAWSGASVGAPAVIESQVYPSRNAVRSVQFATQQTDAIQLIPDDEFRSPGLAASSWSDPTSWTKVGDATLSYLTAEQQVMVRRAVVTPANVDPLDQGVVLDVVHPVFSLTQPGDEAPQNIGGIASTFVQTSPNGMIHAAARITAYTDLTNPLWVQILDMDGQVLAEESVTAKAGDTVEWTASYFLGQYTVEDNYLPDYGNRTIVLDPVHLVFARENELTDLNGGPGDTPVIGYLFQVRVIQKGASHDTWAIDRVSLFDESMTWEFSVDGGETYIPAYGVRNNPNGMVSFPRAGSALRYRVIGYRANLHISSIQIRPIYVGLPTHRFTNMNRGANLSVFDHFPPIQEDPEFKAWSRPVPRWWWLEGQTVVGSVPIDGYPYSNEFSQTYYRTTVDDLSTQTDYVTRSITFNRNITEDMAQTDAASRSGATLGRPVVETLETMVDSVSYTITPHAVVNVYPQIAEARSGSFNPDQNRSAKAGIAQSSASANQPSSSTHPQAGRATSTGTSSDPTVDSP